MRASRRHTPMFGDDDMRHDEDELDRIERDALRRAQHEAINDLTEIAPNAAKMLDEPEKSQRMVVIRADALQKVHELLDSLATSAHALYWIEVVHELRATLPERDS